MAKMSAKAEPVLASSLAPDELNQDLRVASSKLLETTGVMHSFMQSMQTSGFREYIDYLGRPWYTLWINFLMGVGRGLGFVIGATVIVALVVWVISRFLIQLPFVGDFFKAVQQLLTDQNVQHLSSNDFFSSVNKAFDAFKTSILQSTPPADVLPPTP